MPKKIGTGYVRSPWEVVSVGMTGGETDCCADAARQESGEGGDGVRRVLEGALISSRMGSSGFEAHADIGFWITVSPVRRIAYRAHIP